MSDEQQIVAMRLYRDYPPMVMMRLETGLYRWELASKADVKPATYGSAERRTCPWTEAQAAPYVKALCTTYEELESRRSWHRKNVPGETISAAAYIRAFLDGKV